MRAGDVVSRDAIKSIIGDIQTSQHVPNAPSHSKTLSLAIKKRLEAAKSCAESIPPRKGLEELNLAEVEILRQFVEPDPGQLSAEDLTVIVNQTVQRMSIPPENRNKMIGKVIKHVRNSVGEKAETSDVVRVVKNVLDVA